jgi:hypothetical protein
MLVPYRPWIYKNNEKNTDLPEDIWGVEIIQGDFNGAKISFNKVSLAENTSELELDYTLVHIPEDKTPEFYQCKEFEDVISHIITDILNKAIELHENRNNDTSESNQ